MKCVDLGVRRNYPKDRRRTMKEINYSVLKEEIIEALKDIKEIVISTSYKDHVTSRTVYCFFKEESLFFYYI